MTQDSYFSTMYQSDLDYSRQFLFSFGSNYSLATRLFSKKTKEATIIFYAFVRYSDELVDNPQEDFPGKKHLNIEEFIKEWKLLLEGDLLLEDAHPVMRAMYMLCKNYAIPFSYTFDFLDAMRSDIDTISYESYSDLENYMWGSAGVIGHIMTYIIGYSNENAFSYAKSLGEAMQLANFLRDIFEDATERSRIYLPQEGLRRFSVDSTDIFAGNFSLRIKKLVAFYLEQAEKLFREGEKGIVLLNKKDRFPVLLASRIYAYNLKIIKKRNFNPFLKEKVRVSFLRKILILIKTLWSFYFTQSYVYEKNKKQ